MALKLTFLGAGSAFTTAPENYQSNILLELEENTLLLDAGTDIRHSLHEYHKNYKDIRNVYISHLHNDHTGGLIWLALTSFFDPSCNKANLFTAEDIIEPLWTNTLQSGLSTLEHTRPSLDLFFNVNTLKSDGCFIWQGIEFQQIKTIHYHNDHNLMPSYGLIFNYNHTRILFTSDIQYSPAHFMSLYEEADLIFHDCETTIHKSGVHAHYSELICLPETIRKKMWLYHYNPGSLPDAKQDGFLGFVAKGQSFLF